MNLWINSFKDNSYITSLGGGEKGEMVGAGEGQQ